MDTRFFDGDFLHKLEYLSFLAKRIHRSVHRGEHQTYRKGSSLEFHDYRSYQPGDDFRYIDWNIFSRLKRIFVKLFTAEEDLTIQIIVDTSLSMQPKLDYAKRLAAALGYIGIVNLDRVGMIHFTTTLGETLPPMRRRNQTLLMFDFLSRLKAESGTDLNASLRSYAMRTRRPGLVIILSDLMDPGGFRDGILSLLYRKDDVICLHVLDEEEIEPTLDGNIKLVDSETRQMISLTIDKRIGELYRRKLDAYFMEIEEFCIDHGVEYMRTSTMVPFEDVVLKYLRQGMHLH